MLSSRRHTDSYFNLGVFTNRISDMGVLTVFFLFYAMQEKHYYKRG